MVAGGPWSSPVACCRGSADSTCPPPGRADKTPILLAGIAPWPWRCCSCSDRAPMARWSAGGGLAGRAHPAHPDSLDVQSASPRPSISRPCWTGGTGSPCRVLRRHRGGVGLPRRRVRRHACGSARKRAVVAGRNYLVAPAVIYASSSPRSRSWSRSGTASRSGTCCAREQPLQRHPELHRPVPTGEFLSALINTVILTTAAVVAVAASLGSSSRSSSISRFRGRGIVRTMLITPFLVMPVVAALGWKNMMLNPVFGVVDWVITSLGGPRIDWFTQLSAGVHHRHRRLAMGAIHDDHHARRDAGAER